MYFYRKITLIALVLIGISASMLWANRRSCQKLQCFSMTLLEMFKEQDVYEQTRSSYRALLKTGYIMLRADVQSNVKTDEAEKIFSSEIAQIRSLFVNAAAPYPGALSDTITCAESLRPTIMEIETDKIPMTLVSGFLNNRLVRGACVEDQTSYKSLLLFLYCQNTRQYARVELIVPNDEFQKQPEYYTNVATSLTCKR